MPLQNPFPTYPPPVPTPNAPSASNSVPHPPSQGVKGSSEHRISYNANGAYIPINYGHFIKNGLMTYRTRMGAAIAIAYLWCLGGDQGIAGIDEIIINDVLHLDTSDVGHTQTKNYAAAQGSIVLTHYFGLADQPVDAWLAGGLDMPGYDERFVIPGIDDTPLGIAYTVLLIPLNSTYVDEAGTTVEIQGYPQSVRAIGNWMQTRSFDMDGFLPGYASRDLPIYHVVDFLANKAYGLGREIDFPSANNVLTRNGELLPYQIEGGTGTVLRNSAGFSLDTRYGFEQLMPLFEDISESWINDDGEKVSFISDEPRATDVKVEYAQAEFMTDPEPRSASLSDIPNKTTVSYSDPNYQFESRDISATTTAVDNGGVRVKESILSRPWINADHVAKRYAIKALNKANLQHITLRYTATDVVSDVKRGHVHELTHPYGLDSTKIRVLSYQYSGMGHYDISGELYDARAYSDEVVFLPSEPVSNANLTNPPVIEGLALQEVIQTINNKNVSRVLATWLGSAWEGTIGYVVEAWQNGNRILQSFIGPVTDFTLVSYTDLVPLLIRVAVRGDYARGDFVEKEITPLGTYAIPPTPDNFVATEISNTVFLQWDDVVEIGVPRYEIRRADRADAYAQGVYVDRIVGTSLLVTDVPDGTWYFGVATVDEVNQYSPATEDVVTIDYDDDVILQNKYTFAAWDYSVPDIVYDKTLGEERQLIGGTVGMRLNRDGWLVSSHGSIHASNNSDTGSSPYTWLDRFTGPMTGYTGSILSHSTNDNFLPDGDFQTPAEWTLDPEWSIVTDTLVGTNVNNDASARTVMDHFVPANSYVQFRHQVDAGSYLGGDLSVLINGTRIRHPNLVQKAGSTATFQLVTAVNGANYRLEGENNLNVKVNLARAHYTPCRATTETIDMGGTISARITVLMQSSAIIIERGAVEYVVETSLDNTNWTQYPSGTLVNQLRYVRVLIRSVGSTRDCTFMVDLRGLRVKIKAGTIKDSGITAWDTLPDVTQATSLLPDTPGGSPASDSAWLEYRPVANTDVPVVGDTEQRSFFIEFMTGTDITARQVVFTMGQNAQSSVSVYIENSELIITGRFGDSGGVAINVPIPYSRQTIKQETLYTVVITFDYTNTQEFLTYINGKRANQRPEFLDESILMSESYYAFRDPSLQNLEPNVKLGINRANTGDLGGITEPDGSVDSTLGLQMQGTFYRYIQWDGTLTPAQVSAFYRNSWHIDPATYAPVVLYAKFGDFVTTPIYEFADYSGTGRQLQAAGDTTYLLAHDVQIPIVATLNKQFAKLYSVVAAPALGTAYAVAAGNIELGGENQVDTIEFYVFNRNTLEPAFETIDWQISGI